MCANRIPAHGWYVGVWLWTAEGSFKGFSSHCLE